MQIWYGVDPLAEEYPAWNPFAYTMNNPIRFIDPTGMETEPADGDPIKTVQLEEVVVTAQKIPKANKETNTHELNCTTCKTPTIPEPPKINNGSGPAANLAAGWAIAIGEPTPIGEFVMGVASTIAIIYYGPAVIDNTYTALKEILD